MSLTNSYQLSRRDCDFLRVVASILVIVTHCVHVWVMDFYNVRSFWSLGFFATVVDQCVRFTVPTFFFLSGFGLTSQLLKSGPPKLSVYYRTRLPKIVLPFLVWSAITSFRHVAYFRALPWRSAPETAVLHFLKFLFVYGFDYQYYFLIILFQFYLVFPFIYRWMRKGWVVGVVFLIQLLFMTPTDDLLGLLGWHLPAVGSSLLILYGFYFCIGIYIAWHPNFLSGFLMRLSRRQAMILWVASLGLLIAEFYLNIQKGKSLDNSDHFNRWAVILYCVASFVLFMKSKDWIASHFHKNPHWSFVYSGLAPYTFFVYLVHTNVLRWVSALCGQVTLWDFLSRILWVVIGSYLLTWTAQWLFKNFPQIRYALGLPKERLRLSDLPGYSFLVGGRASKGRSTPEAPIP
jgi:peptidoglycan/LPS O-acetylase OafA/YrhL